jgi:lipooligosaccharide transport system permease protein
VAPLSSETPGLHLVRGAETPASWRAISYFAYAYKRTWRGSVVTSFLYPVLYLAAMGLGLGSLVDKHHRLDGVGYVAFIAPGLLAATAMQIAFGEATYPVMAAIKWIRTYHAMLATPLSVRDVLLGHLTWIGMRLVMVATIYLGVVAAFGTVQSPLAVLALPAAILTGLAFAAPTMAYAAGQDNDTGFAALYRFVVVPLFLFSGVFFPIAQLPGWLQVVAQATPLYRGVALCRALVLGQGLTGASIAGDVGYLAALSLAGILVGARVYRRRLVT